MKKLETVAFDYALCRQQMEELQSWLAGKGELSERNDVLPFFRERPQLAMLFGLFNRRVSWADRIAWEFDIFGDFACDLVVGQWAKGAYCFVEFEDARSNSVFEQQGKKATREWGRRFDHGCSQIIDWIHKLNDRSASADFVARFGQYEINFETILVIGREQYLDAGEKQRLKWRSDKVAVNTQKIFCLTFDQLQSEFLERFAILSTVEKFTLEAAKAIAPPPHNPPSTPEKAPDKEP